jgi:hypothetical protein
VLYAFSVLHLVNSFVFALPLPRRLVVSVDALLDIICINVFLDKKQEKPTSFYIR